MGMERGKHDFTVPVMLVVDGTVRQKRGLEQAAESGWGRQR